MSRKKQASPQQPAQAEPEPAKPAATVAPQPETAFVAPEGAPKTKEEAEKLNAAQLTVAFGNKSNAIRGLAALGFTTGEVGRKLDIRYQHARNVLKRPLKRAIKAERGQAAGAGETQSQKQAAA